MTPADVYQLARVLLVTGVVVLAATWAVAFTLALRITLARCVCC